MCEILTDSTLFQESVVTVMQLQPDQKRALLQAKAAAVAELKVISRDRAAITKEISRVSQLARQPTSQRE